MKTSQITPSRLVMALLAAGAIGGAGVAATFGGVSMAASAPAAVASAPAASSMGAPMQGAPNFAQITRDYGPAVVNISISGTRKVSDEDEDPFAQFFGQIPGARGGMPSREVPVRGEGSGFIISSDGIILTNAHVVQGAKEVTVKLTDRREYRAKVLGADPQTDVAVIKIDAKNLPVVKIGDVNQLQVGEWVLAIGSPYGLENTATAGIVSAKGRSLPDDTSVPFIQTDVAVNPGNSGGPLFNDRGEVVGINSQIYSRTGGFQGLSFSIPIDVAYKIKDQILEHGKVRHARLGVTVQEVNQDLANSFKLDTPTGALVSSVEKGSAAEKAGLQPGDVVRKINGKTIVSSGDLASLITLSSPGEKIALDLWRNGAAKEVVATLGGMPKDSTQTAGDSRDVQKGQLGLALRPLSPQEQEAAGAQGLLIEQSAGPAAKAGIQPGDVLLSLNGVPVHNIGQVKDALSKAGKTVALLVQRGEDKIFVPVQLG
ncbi:MAG: DegQ family serine endoprotease [Achromobacter sp.]|uniref:DegQ family serine endoprotease n=1 Tax=Achromobacter sp. TaxID=134375 RepID=UPI003D05EB64